MNADAVAALPWGEYIAKLAATPCLAFREPWSCLNEPEEDGSPEAPMWERDELCPPCLVRAARAALAAAPLPSDTSADGLDVERLERALIQLERRVRAVRSGEMAALIAREYAALTPTQEAKGER